MIRTAVIGCGGMGRNHVNALMQSNSFEIVAACDINPEVLENLPDSVACFQDAEQMFDGVEFDLVSIIVPNYLYKNFVAMAASRGIDVFCEKPFGENLESCLYMHEILKDNECRGWVSAQRKYGSHFKSARQLAAEMKPDFLRASFTYYWGKAFESIAWRGDQQKSGGIAVIDSGWHVFDILHWLFGEPVEVFCRLSFLEKYPQIDDKAVICFRYENGMNSEIFISFTQPDNSFELSMTEGDKAVKFALNSLLTYEKGKETQRVEPEKGENLFEIMYKELADAYHGADDALITDTAQALQIMKTVQACYESHQKGCFVKL